MLLYISGSSKPKGYFARHKLFLLSGAGVLSPHTAHARAGLPVRETICIFTRRLTLVRLPVGTAILIRRCHTLLKLVSLALFL